jgi:hypothetical protein
MITLALAACGSTSSTSTSPATDASSTPPEGGVVRPPTGDCTMFSRRFGPVTLPAATLGSPYSEALRDYADREWFGREYQISYVNGLPPGLELTSKLDPILRGAPTTLGSFEFDVEAYRDSTSGGCSFMPDPQTFRIEVTDGDGGADAGPEAGPHAPH